MTHFEGPSAVSKYVRARGTPGLILNDDRNYGLASSVHETSKGEGTMLLVATLHTGPLMDFSERPVEGGSFEVGA
jgi:hypothetical protein